MPVPLFTTTHQLSQKLLGDSNGNVDKFHVEILAYKVQAVLGTFERLEVCVTDEIVKSFDVRSTSQRTPHTASKANVALPFGMTLPKRKRRPRLKPKSKAKACAAPSVPVDARKVALSSSSSSGSSDSGGSGSSNSSSSSSDDDSDSDSNSECEHLVPPTLAVSLQDLLASAKKYQWLRLPEVFATIAAKR